MSTNLVKVDREVAVRGDRARALEALNDAAKNASTPEEARETMLKAKMFASLLEDIRAPFDEARSAGKASVVAGRRLGRLLLGISSDHRVSVTGRSERRQVQDSIGLGVNSAQSLMRLARADDGEFQRYIQSTDRIPSINGALIACHVEAPHASTSPGAWTKARKKRAGVRTPLVPSLEEGYSLIVRALGHLTDESVRTGANVKKRRDLAGAIDHLYAAEDLLKQYRGGYVN